jgi:hypothetical protein
VPFRARRTSEAPSPPCACFASRALLPFEPCFASGTCFSLLPPPAFGWLDICERLDVSRAYASSMRVSARRDSTYENIVHRRDLLTRSGQVFGRDECRTRQRCEGQERSS